MNGRSVPKNVFQTPKPYIMKSFSYGIIAILLCFFFVSCQQSSNNENTSTAEVNQAPPNPFLGSWELARFFNQDTSVDYQGRSTILFTENHFSWMTSQSERKSFEKLAEPTHEELTEAFNTFSAFTGPYELSDSTLTLTRQIVKRPNWMNPPRIDHYNYQLKDNEIHLQAQYGILEGEKRISENAPTIVLKKK